MKLEYTLVKFKSINLKTREAVKLRGYFANVFKENEIMHNHKENQLIFQYPKVQYKVIGNLPVICGIEEGAKLIANVGILSDEIIIEGEKYDAFQKEIIREKAEFGVEDNYLEYEFLTPWVALNQKNVQEYEKANDIEREEILKKILVGNILSMSKGLNYTVEKNLHVWLDLKECKVKFKNIEMIAFQGRFKVNFTIPNYLAIGKSVSRGFGTVKVIENSSFK